MRRRLKKVTSLIATLLLVISSIPIQPPKEVEAESGYNTGQGQMITGGAGSGSWSNDKQGYRIYVVDNNGNRVSSRVDYIYEYPPDNKVDLKYAPFVKERFPAKGGVGSDKVVQYTKPPRPLIEEQSNVYEAGGEKFSSWFWGGDGNLANKDGTYGGEGWQSPAAQADGRGMKKVEKKEEATENEGNEGGESDVGTGEGQSAPDFGGDNTVTSSKITKPDDNWYDDTSFETNDTVINVEDFISNSQQRYSTYSENRRYVDTGSINQSLVDSYKNAIDLKYKNVLYVDKSLKDELSDIYYSLVANGSKTEAIEILYELTNYAESNYRDLLLNDVSRANDKYIEDENNSNINIDILDSVPLANEGENGIAMLDLKGGSAYYLKIIGNTKKKPSTYILEKGYNIVIEPLFWYPPKHGSNGTTANKFYYGTPYEFTQFYNGPGGIYGKDGGWYKVCYGNVGYRSLVVSSKVTGKGIEIVKHATKSDYKDVKNSEELGTLMMNQKKGLAMHIYYVKSTEDKQYTGYFSESKGCTVACNDLVEPHYPPNPKDLELPKDTNGKPIEYDIVKYYEVRKKVNGKETTEAIERSLPIVRKGNPPRINVRNENTFEVRRYIIVQEDGDTVKEKKTFTDAQKAFRELSGGTRVGSGPDGKDVELDRSKKKNTLIVLLVRFQDGEGDPPPPRQDPPEGDGDIVLEESRVTKAVQSDRDIGGDRTFNFQYDNMQATKQYSVQVGSSCDDEGNCSPIYETRTAHAVMSDSRYKYVIENGAKPTSLNTIETTGAGGAWDGKMENNEKSGTASIAGGNDSISGMIYKTAIWRGKDIPTLAKFKGGDTTLKQLTKLEDKVPKKARHDNGSYYETLKVKFKVSADSDLKNNTVWSPIGGRATSATHNQTNEPAENKAQVEVKVYGGVNDKEEGRQTTEHELPTSIVFNGNYSTHSAGHMVQSKYPIFFYPFINMVYQLPNKGENDWTDVSMLSQYYSGILPNDFAEVGWHTPDPNQSLSIVSTQWSVHARAVNGGGWQGKNQVLPGGAIYHLGNPPADKVPKVGVVTWQTYIDDYTRNEVLYTSNKIKVPNSEYTMDSIESNHKGLVSQVSSVLDNLHVVQWVNRDYGASKAWEGSAVKIKFGEGQVSLGNLSLSVSTSKEEKYNLNSKNMGSDLDIVDKKEVNDIVYKVIADFKGDIYLAKGASIGALASINGRNAGERGATKILTKAQTEDDIDSMPEEARELDKRTKIITNLVMALERNTGNDDTAWWASDGAWYNEAFDGIYVIRKQTNIHLGFKVPKVRSAVLDPKLTPVSNNRGDLYSTAFLSQFVSNDRSDSPLAQGKSPGYVGSFKGKDLVLPDMDKFIQTKKFYIPNVTVQDLR